MKMLFASDVHGSLRDAEKLVERIKAERPDFVMLLGDFCGYSENTIFGEVFGKIPVPYSYIVGNSDREDVLKTFGFCAQAYSAVERFEGRKVFGTHGHIHNPMNLPISMDKGDIFVFGHTHIPYIYARDGINIINCGSMARPRFSDTKTYAVIENGKAYIMSSDGEVIQRADLI